MPWAVSGRRNAASSSPPQRPDVVLNIKLNSRGSVSSHLSCSPGCLLGFIGHSLDFEVVGAEAALAGAAVDHLVAEQVEVPASTSRPADA